MTTRNAYSLVRFSTDVQQFGSSQARQLERHKAECAARGWQFDERLCISDLGVSAYRGKNFSPKFALGKFLEASKRGLLLPKPVLLVENPDRFSRAELDAADSELWGLVKRGVDVLFLSNGLLLTKGDENDPAKRAILMFEFHRANGESKRKSDMVCAAFTRKLAAAKAGTAVQLGGCQPAWVEFVGPDKGTGTFRLQPQAAALVRGIVASYLDGESMLHIAARLNRERVKPLEYAKRWTQGQIAHLLHAELLIGHAQFRGQRIERYYPALIDAETWDRLQGKLAANRERKGGNRDGSWIANLFRNRCTCAACGGSVSSQYALIAGGEVRRYYKCQDARLGRCGVRSMMPIADIEQDFFGMFLQQEPSGLLSQHDQKQQQKIAAIQARLAALDAQVTQAVELLGVVPAAELRAKLAALEAERTQERAKLQELSTQANANRNAPSAISAIRQAILAWDANDGAAAVLDFDKAARELERQLADNETRKKLLALIPSVVQGIEIDLEKRRYRVKSLAGEKSGWRDVA